MPLPAQETWADEKLGLILGQVSSVRRRLNSLAWQHAIFFGLAILVGGAAIICVAAYELSPLAFLVSAALAAIMVVMGVVGAIRTAWRMRASAVLAAAIADDRAELKGRLSTIVALAGRGHHGSLWSYLVEDTLGRREEFAVARIEQRRVSRGVYALGGALLMALIAVPLARLKHPRPAPAPDSQADITMNLEDLHLRAAEPGDENGMPVTADAATMRRLEEKLAREAGPASGSSGSKSLNQMMDRARDLAGKFQNKLTGRNEKTQRLTLRLADAASDLSRNEIERGPDQKKNRRNDVAGQFRQEQKHATGDEHLPATDDSKRVITQPRLGANSELANQASGRRDGSNGDQASRDGDGQQNEGSSNGTDSHGVGADPDSLFGEPAAAKLGNEGFEIAIEARPLEHGANGAGHGYVPPKVRTPLAASQEPDEPVARTTVPPDDRDTIKRVFER